MTACAHKESRIAQQEPIEEGQRDEGQKDEGEQKEEESLGEQQHKREEKSRESTQFMTTIFPMPPTSPMSSALQVQAHLWVRAEHSAAQDEESAEEYKAERVEDWEVEREAT
ncbi:hypothetical protein MMC22_001967 [Lobaria immixta]|nr:hypothetical protein [Lobaria immixta]